MADYTIPGLTSAVEGFDDTVAFLPQAQNGVDNVTGTNGTISAGNINLSADITGTEPGWLTGRRPVSGQLFPRGVYNK
jgi:hypothetical protein